MSSEPLSSSSPLGEGNQGHRRDQPTFYPSLRNGGPVIGLANRARARRNTLVASGIRYRQGFVSSALGSRNLFHAFLLHVVYMVTLPVIGLSECARLHMRASNFFITDTTLRARCSYLRILHLGSHSYLMDICH